MPGDIDATSQEHVVEGKEEKEETKEKKGQQEPKEEDKEEESEGEEDSEEDSEGEDSEEEGKGGLPNSLELPAPPGPLGGSGSFKLDLGPGKLQARLAALDHPPPPPSPIDTARAKNIKHHVMKDNNIPISISGQSFDKLDMNSSEGGTKEEGEEEEKKEEEKKEEDQEKKEDEGEGEKEEKGEEDKEKGDNENKEKENDNNEDNKDDNEPKKSLFKNPPPRNNSSSSSNSFDVASNPLATCHSSPLKKPRTGQQSPPTHPKQPKAFTASATPPRSPPVPFLPPPNADASTPSPPPSSVASSSSQPRSPPVPFLPPPDEEGGSLFSTSGDPHSRPRFLTTPASSMPRPVVASTSPSASPPSSSPSSAAANSCLAPSSGPPSKKAPDLPGQTLGACASQPNSSRVSPLPHEKEGKEKGPSEKKKKRMSFMGGIRPKSYMTKEAGDEEEPVKRERRNTEKKSKKDSAQAPSITVEPAEPPKRVKRSKSLSNATKSMAGVRKLNTREVAEKLSREHVKDPKEKEKDKKEEKKRREKEKGGWLRKKKGEDKKGGGAEGEKGTTLEQVEVIGDKLIEFFESKIQNCEGLFRISGPADKVAILREELLSGVYDKIDDNTEHTCASVMKVIYRDVEELLVPHDQYEKLLEWHDQQAALPDEEAFTDLSGVKSILATLDPIRNRILKKMTRFLAHVASFAEVNMMTPANLGIVFSPNVIQTPAEADVFRQFEDASKTKFLMQLFIEQTEVLFPE